MRQPSSQKVPLTVDAVSKKKPQTKGRKKRGVVFLPDGKEPGPPAHPKKLPTQGPAGEREKNNRKEKERGRGPLTTR